MNALLLIDWQRGFESAAGGGDDRSGPDAERRALRLLEAARHRSVPIVHVVHDSLDPASSLRLDGPGGAPLAGFEPRAGEHRLVKHENGAFAGTGLSTLLRRCGIDRLTVAGLTLPHCVSTTVRMAANEGFGVTLVGDACASFALRGPDGRTHAADLVHAVHLAALHGEFCTVLDTEAALAALATEGDAST